MQQRWKLWSYENGLVLMMSLMNGIVALDRTAVSLLFPWIVPEFHLNNTQLGLLASGLSVTIAASGFLLASLADGTGRRKPILIVMLVLFSLFSATSGLATGFMMLLAARCILGIAEGPLAPIGQSVVALESAPHRRGLNMGIMLNLGAGLIGGGLGAYAVTHVATAFGWRPAFYLSAVPGLVLALAMVFWMRKPPEPARSAPETRTPAWSGVLTLLKSRNILLCLLISGLYSTWLIVQGVFTTIYLTTNDGMKPNDVGLMLLRARYAATAVAISLAAGEILGGVFAPTIAGRIADITGPGAPFWICAGCAGVSGLLALLLKETAPAALAKRAAATA